jgi:hypothetical protein
MSDLLKDRISLGRSLQTAAPGLVKEIQAFYSWLTEAEKISLNVLKLKFTNGRLVSLEHPLGVFEVYEDFVRHGESLAAWIIFCKPASALRERPLPIYVVRLHSGNAFFGHCD